MTTMSAPGSPSAHNGLNETELAVVEAATTNGMVDRRTGDPDVDKLTTAPSWDADRSVSAGLLTGLLTGDLDLDGARLRSVKLCGVRITGRLDLEGRKILCPVVLQDCYFDEAVNLHEAEAISIRLPGCHVPSFNARQLRTSGDVDLDKEFQAAGEVTFYGAHIGGQLVLSGAVLANESGIALNADRLIVNDTMWCDGISARGEFRLPGAHIGGQLTLSGAKLTTKSGEALTAFRVVIDHDMICDDITVHGIIRLHGARIGGKLAFGEATFISESGTALLADGITVDQEVDFKGFKTDGAILLTDAHVGGLSFRGATLANKTGPTLIADEITVDHDMACDYGFTAQGEVRLTGAHIGGSLRLDRARIINRGGSALLADRLTVNENMSCRGFSALGEVRLLGANIRAQLILDGAEVKNENGRALMGEGLIVGHSMFCRDGFTAYGEVQLVGARIGGMLYMNKAKLINEGHIALRARGLTIEHDLFCAEGFTAQGEVDLRDAHISRLDLFGEVDLRDADVMHTDHGNAMLRGARLSNHEKVALNLAGASVGSLHLPEECPDGAMDFTNAKVEVLSDRKEGWPQVLRIRGFTYDHLTNLEKDTRLDTWLRRHEGPFTPQIYDQLAGAYQRAGEESAARQVAIAKQRCRRKQYSPLSLLWRVTVGYGYQTWLALVWVAGFELAGSLVFGGVFFPVHMLAVVAHPPVFQPVIYTLDVLLPIGGLGQKSAWQPTASGLLGFYWTLAIAGWVLGVAVVAGLSGILKRD